MSSLSSQIEADAAKAKRLKSGDMEREAHSLKDQIAADKYLCSQDANTAANRRGVVITKMRPPGSI